MSETTFNQTEWEATKERLLEAVREFQSHQEQDEFKERQRAVDEHQLEQYQAEIQKLAAAIEALSREQQQSSEDEETDYSQFPTEAMERIAQQLDSAWLKLSKSSQPPRVWYRRIGNWLLAVWRVFTGRTDKAIISRLNQRLAEDVALTKNTPFPLELILNRKHLEY